METALRVSVRRNHTNSARIPLSEIDRSLGRGTRSLLWQEFLKEKKRNSFETQREAFCSQYLVDRMWTHQYPPVAAAETLSLTPFSLQRNQIESKTDETDVSLLLFPSECVLSPPPTRTHTCTSDGHRARSPSPTTLTRPLSMIYIRT
jgi:hypothetical protein